MQTFTLVKALKLYLDRCLLRLGDRLTVGGARNVEDPSSEVDKISDLGTKAKIRYPVLLLLLNLAIESM